MAKRGRKKKAWNMSNPLYRYLNGKKNPIKRKRRASIMARKRKTRGFGKSNSLMSLLKPALYGAGASYLAARVGVSVPNWAAGAAGGYLAKNNLNSAAVGAIGAIGAPMVLEKINANTGASSNNSGFIG